MSLKLNRPKSGSISSSAVDNEASYKLVMVGDSGVGKSCLLDKFLDDSSANNFISTIGVDIKTRETTINNRKIKVQVCQHLINYIYISFSEQHLSTLFIEGVGHRWSAKIQTHPGQLLQRSNRSDHRVRCDQQDELQEHQAVDGGG